MRKRIYEIVENARPGDYVSYIYKVIMLIAIVVSILPLMQIEAHSWFRVCEGISVSVFAIDYILRWITADFKLDMGKKSFWVYPFTVMAVIDVLSILPVFQVLHVHQGFKILRMTRLFMILRVFRFLRYSDKISVFLGVLKKEKSMLMSVLIISLFYVFLTALIMFNVEPHVNPYTGAATFDNFFDALYWATVTLTTVGYGDLCPVTDIGRLVSMLSSIFGVAIIALPSGVITASYLDELRLRRRSGSKKEASAQANSETSEQAPAK